MRLPGPRPGLVWPVVVDPRGQTGPTPKQARGPRWRTTSRGRFVPVGVEPNVGQRIVEAAMALPPSGAISGWAALWWLGGEWFDGMAGDHRRPVVLATGTHDIRRQSGFVISQEGLGPRDIQTTDGLRVTTALRSVLFEMRYAPSLTAAVRAVDQACYSDLVSIQELAAYVAVQTGSTGIQRARDALALADENSWSPRETDLRLAWRTAAGPTPALVNRPLFDLAGRHLATPDLFVPEAALALEYNGTLHLLGQRRRRDRDRVERLVEHDVETVEVMAGDSTDRVVDRMIRAHRRRMGRAPRPRSWTTRLPSWWRPTFTVDQRRALPPGERDMWLSYRGHAG